MLQIELIQIYNHCMPLFRAVGEPCWGGGGMSPVDFKKWHCPLSLILHVDFKIAKYRLSNSREGSSHVSNMFPHVNKFHVTCPF